MAPDSAPEAPSQETRQQSFEQGVAYSLHLWPALTLAVQNQWGGPDSEDKRDWFAGAIVELFPDLSKTKPPPAASAAAQHTARNGSSTGATQEEPEISDVETVLLQAMLDEFEVNVDDDSAFEVAEQIMRLRGDCAKGRFEEVDTLRKRWESRKGTKVTSMFRKGEDQDDETDWSTDEDEDGEDGECEDKDVEMGDAPPLATRKKEKPAPEVDEDGFTKVSKKKR